MNFLSKCMMLTTLSEDMQSPGEEKEELLAYAGNMAVAYGASESYYHEVAKTVSERVRNGVGVDLFQLWIGRAFASSHAACISLHPHCC